MTEAQTKPYQVDVALLICRLAGASACILMAARTPHVWAEPAPPFAGPPSMEAPGVLQTAGVCSAHLDGDGRIDLVIFSAKTARLSVMVGSPAGFRLVSDIDAGASATGCAIADFNEDNKVDVAVSHHDTDEVWLFFGKGGGAFGEPGKVRVPVTKPHAHMLLAADVNADRHTDVILAQADDNKAWILLGDGKGGLVPSPASPIATGNHPYVVTAADFNGDGKLDLATPNWYGRSVSVFLGDGTGAFKDAPGSPIGGFAAPTALAAGELTDDGKIDLAVGNDDSRRVQILAGDGVGRFAVGAVADLEADGDCFTPIVADLNGDGKLDVIATAVNNAPTFSYWINLGGGKFSPPHSLPCPSAASRIHVSDLNGDNVVDLFVGTWEEAKSYIWLGRKP